VGQFRIRSSGRAPALQSPAQRRALPSPTSGNGAHQNGPNANGAHSNGTHPNGSHSNGKSAKNGVQLVSAEQVIPFNEDGLREF
jgi:hypothetical protein